MRVSNITERAKREVAQVEADLETQFVFPFLRGRDVQQWSHHWSAAILLPHTAESRMRPVSEVELAEIAPLTLSYFRQFRSELDARQGFVGWERQHLSEGFYACQRVGEYTFAPWKVVWRYIAPTFITAVIGPCKDEGAFAGKPLIANEKLMIIACASPGEAYYLGGVLASAPVVRFVESRMVSTQIAPHVVKGLGIPAFDESSPRHRRVSALCEEGHRLVEGAGRIPVDLLGSLDEQVGLVLGIDPQTSRSLRDLGKKTSDDAELASPA